MVGVEGYKDLYDIGKEMINNLYHCYQWFPTWHIRRTRLMIVCKDKMIKVLLDKNWAVSTQFILGLQTHKLKIIGKMSVFYHDQVFTWFIDSIFKQEYTYTCIYA